MNKITLLNVEQTLPVDVFRQVLAIAHQVRATLCNVCEPAAKPSRQLHTLPSKAQINCLI